MVAASQVCGCTANHIAIENTNILSYVVKTAMPAKQQQHSRLCCRALYYLPYCCVVHTVCKDCSIQQLYRGCHVCLEISSSNFHSSSDSRISFVYFTCILPASVVKYIVSQTKRGVDLWNEVGTMVRCGLRSRYIRYSILRSTTLCYESNNDAVLLLLL